MVVLCSRICFRRPGKMFTMFFAVLSISYFGYFLTIVSDRIMWSIKWMAKKVGRWSQSSALAMRCCEDAQAIPQWYLAAPHLCASFLTPVRLCFPVCSCEGGNILCIRRASCSSFARWCVQQRAPKRRRTRHCSPGARAADSLRRHPRAHRVTRSDRIDAAPPGPRFVTAD